MKFIIATALLAAIAVVNSTSIPRVSRPVPSAPHAKPSAPHATRTMPAKCSCTMPDSIKDGYKSDSTPIFKAEAVETRNVGDPNYSYTVMRVRVVFRGCAPSGEYIVVQSPKTVSACGVHFVPGTMYAVTAKLSRSATPPPGLPPAMEVYTATSCSYSKPWTSCPQDDRLFLYYSPVRGCPTA